MMRRISVFGKGRGVLSNWLIIVIIIKISLDSMSPLQLTDIYRYLAPDPAL